ncbi:MAG: AtpZ/AtpI family protein [Nitrospirota bacterium]
MADEQRQEPTPEEPKGNFFHLLGTVSTVGINLVVSTFVGFAIGWGLDKLFGTSFLKIIFLILGIIAGFIHLFRVALKSSENKDSDKPGNP